MIKAVDLFSGAGGLSLACKLSGVNVVGALEMDKYSCETYRKNLISGNSRTTLVQDDITSLTATKFMKLVGISRGDCDLLIGGPPCQGFSALQSKKDGSDPRNKLLLQYFAYLQAIKPKAFLIENVPGILWRQNKPFLDEFYFLAQKSGYRVFMPALLDAKDYGVPQTRKRVFIFGLLSQIDYPEINWIPKKTNASPDSLEVSSGVLMPWLTASSVFSKPFDVSDINNVHMNHSKDLIDVFKSTPINGGSRHQSNRVLKCHAEHNGHKDVYGRIDPKRPGPTMTTSCTNPSKGRFVHPTKHHGITVRHAARFQGFPDNYIFYGGIIAASRQVGNAVPIDLGKAIIKKIKKIIEISANKEIKIARKTANS